MADIGGVQGLLGKYALPTTKSSFGPQNLLTGDVKQSVQAINPVTKTKTTPTLKTAKVQPVRGQVNDTPVEFPDLYELEADYYRNGSGSEADPETFLPRTLGAEQDQVCSMTLQQPVPSKTLGAQGSAGAKIIDAYTRFFLQSVVEAEQEKYQIVETFTGYYAFFYGKRPPIYRFTGVLLNDVTYRWANDFKYVYENFFRGTSAVEYAAEVIMNYDGRVVVGFPLSLTMQQDSINDKGIPFSMDLLVISHTPIRLSTDIDDLLRSKMADLAALKGKIKATTASLLKGSSPSVLQSDQVTNQIRPPFAVDVSTTTSARYGAALQNA